MIRGKQQSREETIWHDFFLFKSLCEFFEKTMGPGIEPPLSTSATLYSSLMATLATLTAQLSKVSTFPSPSFYSTIDAFNVLGHEELMSSADREKLLLVQVYSNWSPRCA